MTTDVKADWYTDFFTELPNEFWRRAVPPEATVAEVDGGFTDVACFGGPDGAPFAVGDGRLLLTARRGAR